MKRHIPILSTLLVVALFFGAESCSKKQPPDTLFSKMLGQWKKTAYATDDNGNGIIDAGEIHPQPANILDELVFKSDTSGYENTIVNKIQEVPLNFKWYVYAESLAVAYSAHDTIVYYIDNVNSYTLALYTNTSTGLAAYYYSK